MITEPVEVRVPIVESGLTKVFKMPGIPTFYRVEATAPDGLVKVIERVRSYTKSLTIDDKTGRVELEIDSENPGVLKKWFKMPYPYHYMHAGTVLCVMKNCEIRDFKCEETRMKAFGLNYALFELPWQLCIVLHKHESKMLAFATSRMEWDRGTLNADGRELQMFIQVPEERHVPVSLMRLMVDAGIAEWMVLCENVALKKGFF